jgi:hypothetical protein
MLKGGVGRGRLQAVVVRKVRRKKRGEGILAGGSWYVTRSPQSTPFVNFVHKLCLHNVAFCQCMIYNLLCTLEISAK